MSDATRPPRITVVGDLILDRYLIGDATKLNPEMPGVVIRIDKEEDRLGGAAAVAMIAAGLGARVTLAGVTGNDEAGARLRQLVDEYGIQPHIWTADRPTTWKQRIVARGQLRPDRCDRETTFPIGPDAEHFLSCAPLGDVLLISDYGKGICTGTLLGTLAEHARNRTVPILVDPARSRNWSEYGHVCLIKANQIESAEASDRIRSSPMELAKWLSQKHQCHVVVTLGDRGLVCTERGGETISMAGKSTAVKDVCGAGDTVLAAIGVAVAQGFSLSEACRFAIEAAAAQVASLGISAVNCRLPSLNEAAPGTHDVNRRGVSPVASRGAACFSLARPQ